MSVTDIHAAVPSTREVVIAGLRAEADTWLFVAKTLLSFFIAGWLAMRLALPQPSTVMITTIIVANRQSGMVLAKSFYRAMGTLGGAAAALLIVALFPQERVLFLAALSLWVGLCSAGASLYRNFKSYGFVLGGYTAAIVALPVINHPPDVFQSAVARVSEVLLAILVSAVVSDAVFPVQIREVLRRTAREQFVHFIQFVHKAMCGRMARSDIEAAHLRFVRDAVTLEDMRSSVIFENPEARARSGHMLLMNQQFMAASTSLQSLHHLINRLKRDGRKVPADALIELYVAIAVALDVPMEPATAASTVMPRLDAAQRSMDAHAQVLRGGLTPGDDVRDFDTGAGLLHRFTQELRDYVATSALLSPLGGVPGVVERVRFTRGNDFYSAGLAMLRTSMTMGVLSVFWITSEWPYGTSAMLIATVFAGLFAAAPNPTKAIGANVVGFFFGAWASFLCQFFVLTKMDGYGLFVAGSAPFLMPGLVLIMWPALMPVGLGYSLGFAITFAAKNQMVFDIVHFANDTLADFIGLGWSAVAFVLVPPTFGSPWFRRHQFELLRRQVSVAAQAPLPGLHHRFESVNHDLFGQIVAQTTRGSQDSKALVAWALAVNESGRALIELRSAMARRTWPDDIRSAVEPAVAALARLYEQPSADGYVRARDALFAAIERLGQEDATLPLLVQLNLLRMALLDEESVMAQYMPKRPSAGGAHAS
ncbi:MAG TPA: FUSC family protein [Dyella sp.]|uniref:FUSC family protein n=1 Tax=Dyella sp. TaxID=1869338 RepID=UPI002B5DA2DD|nr:FUSC family protein [Dyella sp.]HTV86905.1 FUSC family protein [Dyella sp.]